jgi:hypothetical protein
VFTARHRLAAHLLRLPIAEYDARRTGDLLSRVGADTTLLRVVITSGLLDDVTGVVMVGGARSRWPCSTRCCSAVRWRPRRRADRWRCSLRRVRPASPSRRRHGSAR